MNLGEALSAVAVAYADLEDALIPGRSGEPAGSPDPTNRPAPGNVQVMEHRHKLVRGLRWWVDALRDGDTRVGQDVDLMCRWLWENRGVLEPEDAAELLGNLTEWLRGAWGFMGHPDPARVEVAPAVLDQRVRVADAARMLGCSVRTVQRRVPVEQRAGGLVLLREAWRCELCDLRHGECAHTVCLLLA